MLSPSLSPLLALSSRRPVGLFLVVSLQVVLLLILFGGLIPLHNSPSSAMHEIIQLTVTGHDQVGVTAILSDVLAAYNINVLDIGQAVVHGGLSLGMVIEVPDLPEAQGVFRDLLFAAHSKNLNIMFKPLPVEEYEKWVGEQGRPKHFITLLAPHVTAGDIGKIANFISERGLNMETIVRLSGRVSVSVEVEKPRAQCVEIRVSGAVSDEEAMHRDLLYLARGIGIDVAVQEDSIYRGSKRLVAFDMDSTLIQTEVIDELAHEKNVFDQVAAITASAMRGEIDFRSSLRERLALLKGLDVSVMDRVAKRLPLTDGVERLMRTLRWMGLKTAIISGGFTFFGNYLQKKLGFDYVFANELAIEDGKLTGGVIGDIVDAPMKAKLLEDIANREGIRLEQTIAVGDGSNDLLMLGKAGLGIAFHAKPIVQERAKHRISSIGLDGLLFLIGLRDRDVLLLERKMSHRDQLSARDKD